MLLIQFLWFSLASMPMGATMPTTVLSDSCMIFPEGEILHLRANCDEQAHLCTTVAYNQDWLYGFEVNGRAVQAQQACAFDTIRYYTINHLISLGDFAPYFVNNWQVNDERFSGEFLVMSDLVDSLNRWDPIGDWSYDAFNSLLRGGHSGNTYGELQVEILVVSSTITALYTTVLTPNQVALDLPIGTHQVVATQLNTGCQDSITVHVTCSTTDVFELTIDEGETRQICLKPQELIRDIASIEDLNASAQYSWDAMPGRAACLAFTGMAIGRDTAHILVCDELGICDTNVVHLNIRAVEERKINKAFVLGEEGDFCIDLAQLELPGTPTSLTNICSDTTDEIVELEFGLASSCLHYRTLQEGRVLACMVLCDNFRNCDTLSIDLNIVRPKIIQDTVLVYYNEAEYCLDTRGFADNMEMRLDCEEAQTGVVDFRYDKENFCVSYIGTRTGRDSSCIWMHDQLGNASLTILQIEVTEPQSAVALDSVFVNETIQICVDTTEIPGRITRLLNICPEDSGEKIDFFIISKDCIELTGLDLGQESACLVVCDHLGYCDTTYYTIQVAAYPEAPSAEDARLSTDQNTSVQVEVLNNIIGELTSIDIIVQPTYGFATISQAGQITYTPSEDACIGSDVFEYEICNNNGCDRGQVNVEITCNGIEVYTAMSPNGDGLNDVLFISNIEATSQNRLHVYNRWGNLVFQQKNYDNTWDGTWKGKPLPDGTYFYIFNATERGKQRTFRGHVELHR